MVFSILFMSLRGRLVLLACSAMLPALLFTFFIANNERSAALKRIQKEASHLAGLATREHAHQIEGARSLLLWLGDMIAREGGNSFVITDQRFLPALLSGYPQLVNVGVLTANGGVLRSAYPMRTFPSMRDNPAFVRALRSRDVETGRYIVSPIVHRPVLNLAYAVRGHDGAVRWVVFSGINLQWLGDLARQANLPSDYSLLIIDRKGRVLAESGAVEKKKLAGAGAFIPELASLSARREGKFLKVGNTDVKRYFIAAPLGEIPGVSVVVGLPYERTFGEANGVFYRTLWGLALITLLAAGSVLVAAEVGILRAMRTLSRAARRFGAGDLSARAVTSRGHGELHELATAFNAMADALAARHREITEAHDRLLALSRHLQVARETEAARIARELHDEIGQVLTSLKIDIVHLKRHCLESRADEPCAGNIEKSVMEMCGQLDGAVDFVRRTASELRPTVLDRLGLAAAIEWQANELEARTDLIVEVKIRNIEEPIDWLISTTVFRIVQEALTNVVRHADATTVRIGLSGGGGEIVLTVGDDGKGIAADNAESLGIIGMRERARLVNGEFAIRGEAGKGATVTVRIPRQRVEEESHANPDC